MRRRTFLSSLMAGVSSLTMALFCTGHAQAQDASPAENIESVTVTGSRLSTGFSSPTPLTEVSASELQQVDSTNIANALVQMPQLVGSALTYNAGSASPSAGTNGQSLLNLRGLGANRTLVLLDGTRLAPTNTGGTVDVNNIPQALISRVDIVTGGASAAYGTDAVAGVVNFILNTHFEGLKASVEGGETQYGDGGTVHGSVVYGTSFLGGRARIIGSVDIFTQNGIGDQPNGRYWYDYPVGAYGNPVAGALPTTIQEPNVRSSIGTAGGLITGVNGCATPACKAIILTEQFGPGDVLEPYNNGTLPSQSSGWTSGGDGEFGENGMSPEQHREQYFAHGEYDLNSHVTGWAEGWFNQSHTDLQGQPAFVVGSKYQLTAFAGNPYLPAGLVSFFAANPTATSVTYGRYMSDTGAVTNDDNMIYQRVSGGFKGDITDKWSFDSALAYNRVQQNLWVQNNTINRNVYAAADAVVNPQTGAVVCRSQYYNSAGVFVPGGTGEDPGCVPTNFFGSGSVTPQAASYIEGTNEGNNVFHQTSFEANVRGDLGDDMQFGAGPISVALGLSWYSEDAHRTVDALSDTTVSCTGLRGCPTALNGLYGGYQLYNPLPLNGASSVTEAYTEFGIPLLKDLPLVKSLDIDAAGRMADYSTSGVTYSDKLGVNWMTSDDLRIRVTYSQDVRAPNLTELFSTGQASTGQLSWPASNPTFTGSPNTFGSQDLTEGNQNLKPEHAHTSTIGFVFSPTWLPGFTTSVDYYDIAISGAITSVPAQQVVNNCFLGQQQYCNLITVAGQPVTTTVGITGASPDLVVTSEAENLAKVYTSGFDLEMAYSTDFWNGTLTSRLLANWLGPNGNSSNTPGTITLGGYGADRYNLSALYDTSDYSVFLEERFLSNGLMNPNLIAGQTISYNNVPWIYYTNMTLTYKFTSFFDTSDEFYLTVTNVFNQPPPVTVTTGGNWIHSTDYSVYDVLGRRFLAGIRVRL